MRTVCGVRLARQVPANLSSSSLHRWSSFVHSRFARNNSNNAFGSSLPEVLAASGWDGVWKQQVTPWDAGKPAPILTQLLDGAASVGGPLAGTGASRVLCPGVGQGYDAAAFAQKRPTVGLDIAPTAVAAAIHKAESDPSTAALLKSGQLSFVEADFFAHVGVYHTVFDYTFLCALPPELWPRWAETVHRLVAPGGELVHLIFPVGDHKGGPPFALQPDTVSKLLEPLGWETTFLAPVPPELSHKARAGREWLGRYRHSGARYPIINTAAHGIMKQSWPRKK